MGRIKKRDQESLFLLIESFVIARSVMTTGPLSSRPEWSVANAVERSSIGLMGRKVSPLRCCYGRDDVGECSVFPLKKGIGIPICVPDSRFCGNDG